MQGRLILGEEKIPTLSRILRKFKEKGLRKKDLRQVAINMYRKGLSSDLIAKVINVDIKTIKSWLKKENLL